MSEKKLSLQEIIGLLEQHPDRYEGIRDYPVLKFTNGKEMWALTVRTPAGNTMEVKGYMKRAREALAAEAQR